MMTDFHGVATVVSQRLLFSMVGGTLLAAAVWLLLQVFPKRDARTNFAIWFSTLLATAMLPLFSIYLKSRAGAPGGSTAVFTVSTAVAWYAFIAWAVIALLGLARVVLATFQLRRLRADAMPVEMESLPEKMRANLEREALSSEMLTRGSMGFGMLALASLLSKDGRAAESKPGPLAPRPPHFPPKVEHVIFCYMSGGVSHIDSFDRKTRLDKEAGKILFLPCGLLVVFVCHNCVS